MKIIKMIPVVMSVLASLYFYVNNVVSTFYSLTIFLVFVKKSPEITFNSIAI